jgi:hypothetical protein
VIRVEQVFTPAYRLSLSCHPERSECASLLGHVAQSKGLCICFFGPIAKTYTDFEN